MNEGGGSEAFQAVSLDKQEERVGLRNFEVSASDDIEASGNNIDDNVPQDGDQGREPDELFLDNSALGHPFVGAAYFLVLWYSLYDKGTSVAYIYPLLFLPTVCAALWWKKYFRETVSGSYLQTQFIIGFAPMALGVMIAQIIVGVLWAGFVLDWIGDSENFFVVYFGLLVYLMGAVTLVEETIKTNIAVYVRQMNASRADSKPFLIGSLFMALGLGTSQVVFIAMIIYSILENGDKHYSPGEKNTIVIGGVVSTALINVPLHCVAGYLISIRVAKAAQGEDDSWASMSTIVRMAAYPAICRGFFLVNLIVFSIIFHVLGTVLADVIGIVIIYVLISKLKKEEGELPREYLESVGYSSLFDEGFDVQMNDEEGEGDQYFEEDEEDNDD